MGAELSCMCLREGKIDGTFLGALTPKRMDSIRQPNDAPNPSGMDRESSLGLGKSESPKPKLDFEAIVEEPPAAAEHREAGIAAHRICSAALRSADEDLDQHRLAQVLQEMVECILRDCNMKGDAQEYFDQHRVPQALKEAIECVLRDQPSEPTRAIGALLLASNFARCRGVKRTAPMESPWPSSASGSAVERLDRKVASVFYSGLEVPPDITSGLGDPRVRDKVLAYALSFVQQYLKLGHAEKAASLLAAFPRRKNGGKHDPKETEKSWVYRYLVIDEPLQLGRSGGLEIAGARGLAAADAGALFTATFGVAGAPDAKANVRLRLFVELAPKWIAFLAKALGTATAAEAAAADWAADCPLAIGVSDGAACPHITYLQLKTTPTMEKPADEDAAEMATEVERLRELPHERGGLLAFAPPRDEQPAALGFSLGTEVPTTASRSAEMVVLGRLLDGQKELAHLAKERGRKSAMASASAGFELRLLRFHKTPHLASAGAG
ncbi:hypothetical protein Ctob_008866 [Chrysochromulina tobinii]|uniref:Uncharacterized protein n=1 Tax=Chrysochromulina tobinii TaxID=1460289 RepID=A0A0M0K2D2_9EUKA|nr:hypothetical protein Ctob_008866 [Chrysochromulina tobinii]|eukprot:KOO32543.1 hypothetical protein Ctob_008866 [Chrysochromulina sp. CCMP291]